jgi:aldehyde:ferredoxin oxidoreductase
MDIDEKGGIKIARRINALTRAYNVRLGISRKDDRPPERHFSQATVPPVLPPLDRSIFDRAIDSYYKLRGYDKDGMPTKKTLNDLDLDYVAQDLVKRGILPDENERLLSSKGRT